MLQEFALGTCPGRLERSWVQALDSGQPDALQLARQKGPGGVPSASPWSKRWSRGPKRDFLDRAGAPSIMPHRPGHPATEPRAHAAPEAWNKKTEGSRLGFQLAQDARAIAARTRPGIEPGKHRSPHTATRPGEGGGGPLHRPRRLAERRLRMRGEGISRAPEGKPRPAGARPPQAPGVGQMGQITRPRLSRKSPDPVSPG